MPEPNYAQELNKLEEAIDAIKEAQESAEGIADITEQLDALTGRINEARENPDSLNADTYADLALDLMLVIPNNLPLPDAAKKAIEALASVIASFIQGATGLALTLLAKRFRELLRTGMTPEDAAKTAANGKAEQSWLLAQYRAGTVTAAGDTRDVKTPTEWLWDKITGIFSSLVGGIFTTGRSPLPLMGCALLLLAVVVVGAAVATGFFGDGSPGTAGDPVPTRSEAQGPSSPPGESSAPAASEPPAVGGSFDSLTTHGLWPSGLPSRLDAVGDVIYSDPAQQPGHAPDYVDAILSGGAIVDASQQVVDEAFNASTFDCNVATEIRTVCITNADIAAGPILVVATKMAGQIPAEPAEGLVIYSLVLDSDGDPANDYEATAPFTWDFYQGTDRWYELVYTPDLGWYLTVDRGETASDARVAIWGDHTIFFVPMSELPSETPRFRTTAFASSDATYAPQTSGGDVTPGPPDDEWDLAEPAR